MAPPARSNPIVIASDNKLIVIGGSCMGKHLVQLYQVRYFSVTGHHNFLYVSMFQVSNTTPRHGR